MGKFFVFDLLQTHLLELPFFVEFLLIFEELVDVSLLALVWLLFVLTLFEASTPLLGQQDWSEGAAFELLSLAFFTG